ncbi:M15 family metallopeptidase [Streptomyces sp. NPDC057543]|uniref:M15 family metallopeptidase n=1 Tax=Streptomyces sp. NPDC057543 TaxID=3346163 RepID=UPI0036963DDD
MTTPRLATPADAGEIACLRSELILSQPLDASWLTTGQELLAARLQPGGDARAYVIDATHGTLATCALGLVHCVLPAPRYPKGLAVRIHAVATDRAYQRRGYAKAGAAVDLTLVDADGVELGMGTAVNANPEVSAGACYTRADNISPHARANRNILVTALSSAGLVNYSTEWWHFSYGDRYWALTKRQKAALYGPAERP